MDPQLEEYRRKQRERAEFEVKKCGGKGGQKLMVPIVLAVAVLFAMVKSQSMEGAQASGLAQKAQGTCPKPVGMGICVEECATHDDCQAQGKLCCSNGCGHVCISPEKPGQSGPPRTCTLMVTLAEKEGASERVLQAVPAPSSHNHLSSVGILILEYKAGRVSDCCAAEHALLASPDDAKYVEYDGAKPSCASSSSSGEVQAIDSVNTARKLADEDKEVLMGAFGGNSEVDEEAHAVWDQLLAKSPVHENHDLKAFGKPVSVKTQVVAGVNYHFTFSGGQAVEVFHQPWSDTLEVSSVQL